MTEFKVNRSRLSFWNALMISLAISFMSGMAFYREDRPSQDLPVVTVRGNIVFHSAERPREGLDEVRGYNHLYLVNAGQLHHLGAGDDPRWSPDGRLILCKYPLIAQKIGYDFHLVITSADEGGELYTLPNLNAYAYPMSAAWTPDGRKIIFAGPKQVNADHLEESHNVFAFDLETNRMERQLTHFPDGATIHGLDVSPDGQRIVFSGYLPQFGRHMSAFLMNIDGSNLQELVHAADFPRWSPDGTRITYATNYDNGQQISKFYEIWIMDVQSRKTTRVTHNEWQDMHPTWSPDGKQLCFVSCRHVVATYGCELFVINTDGSGELRITSVHTNPEARKSSLRYWATDDFPDWHSSSDAAQPVVLHDSIRDLEAKIAGSKLTKMEINRGDHHYYNHVGATSLAAGQYGEATQAFQRAYELTQDKDAAVRYMILLGEASELSGDYASALAWRRKYESNIQRDTPQSKQISDERIMSLEAAVQGRFDQAIAHAHKGMKLALKALPKEAQKTKTNYLRRIRALEERARAAGQLPPDYVPATETEFGASSESGTKR